MAYEDKTWVLGETVMPEHVNKIEIGIKNATNTAEGAIPKTEKGATGGVATLGSDGKVTSSQLPPVQVIPDASTTAKGIVKLNNSLSSNSESEAVTQKAVSDLKIYTDQEIGAKANINSPNFGGTPTTPTATKGTNTTQIASTAFVQTALADKANLNAPAFTGYPTSTTPSASTNSTVIATTAFVQTNLATKANLASPAFTGNPTALTQPAGNNTTRLATTAFVQQELVSKLAKGANIFNASGSLTGSIDIYFTNLSNIVHMDTDYFEVVSSTNYGSVVRAKKKLICMVAVTFSRQSSINASKTIGIIKMTAYNSSIYDNISIKYAQVASGSGLHSESAIGVVNLNIGNCVGGFWRGSSSDVLSGQSCNIQIITI